MPQEYEHIEFSFNKPSGRRNGKHYEVTAYLLVPVEAMPEFRQWEEAITNKAKEGALSGSEIYYGLSGLDMYETLRRKGALLHREDGAAYKEVEKSAFDKNYAQVIKEEYWVKGMPRSGTTPQAKSLGKYTL